VTRALRAARGNAATATPDEKDSDRSMTRVPSMLLATAVALGSTLAGCGHIDVVAPRDKVAAKPMTKPAHRWTCPPTLAYIRRDLVTPKKDWDSFLGEGVMNKTLNQPIDVMIKQGGGYEPSVMSGRKYVAYYEDILAHPDKVREEYAGYGKSEDWIKTYMLTVRDGVTINQAFVDAVECRRANGWLEAQAPVESGASAAPAQPKPQP
jgi:hypothetical protein